MTTTEKNWSYSDLADLTHETQVKNFGWCSCEEQEHFPYDDCPRPEIGLTKCHTCPTMAPEEQMTNTPDYGKYAYVCEYCWRYN